MKSFLIYNTSAAGFIPTSEKGVADGVATLDNTGLVPFSQLPFSSPLDYHGTWNADTNTPTLTAGSGTLGDMYIVNVSGTKSIGEGSILYAAGDVIVSDASGNWIRIGSVGGAFINGTGFVKADGTVISYITGTSSQFIKADGSLDSSTYLTSSILSTANTWTAAQRSSFSNLTDAATITIDLSLANNFRVVLGGNRTLGVPTNIVEGQSGVINVFQDGTGSRTLSYAWPFMFASGTAPTLSTGKYTIDQLVYMVNRYATSTVTISNATPAVITWNSHGLISGQRIQLSTTGSLPTGLATSTTYWVYVVDANTFRVSTSLANLQAGTYVATSSAGSGTHTATCIQISVTSNTGLA